MQPDMRDPGYLRVLPDGTVKQRNPFNGTEVWTVPGRAARPMGIRGEHAPIDHSQGGRHCAFCEGNYLATPPEKSRVVRTPDGWETRHNTPASQLFDTVAEFRRVPNLFEILGFDYWHANHGYELPPEVARVREAYLAEPEGLRHVLDVVGAKLRASGLSTEELERTPIARRLEAASGFFGGGHDVVIARRHFVEGATDEGQLCASGSLSVEEHEQFVKLTVDALQDLYEKNRYARYVAVFQNWLRPAGASFDHLHKQLVAIDEHGGQQEAPLARVLEDPNVFNNAGPHYASRHGLMVAENEHALAYAGFGHRYPTIEIYSKSSHSNPWEHEECEIAGVSEMLHAMHAATGPEIPTNEEWHYKPIEVTVAMPWRIMLKWRVSTVAGFEGATKLYLNTITPASLCERVVGQLLTLRGIGHVPATLRIGSEVGSMSDPLRYGTGS